MTTDEAVAYPLPPGYGVWLNDDGTWYVMRGYREYRPGDGTVRMRRDGPMIRYQTLYNAKRGAWRDFRRNGQRPGNAVPIRL